MDGLIDCPRSCDPAVPEPWLSMPLDLINAMLSLAFLVVCALIGDIALHKA
jgi:hypothetical protein